MTKIIFASLILAASGFSYAAEKPQQMSGYHLKIQFSYKDTSKQFQTRHELIVNENNQDWIPLTIGQQGVALLGKIHKAEKGIFTAEYMIVDTTSNPVAIQTMAIISQLGKESEIKSEAPQQKAQVLLLATPTEYTQAN